MRRHLVVGILIFCASFWAFGDALYLTDGTKLEGTIQTETSENITIKTSLVTLTIPQYRIQKIEKDKGGLAEPESTDSEGKTTFEQAEELYHEGKVQAALPLYEKALQEDPNNSDAARRMSEIRDKTLNRIRREGAEGIKALSEQDVILSVARRADTALKQPARGSTLVAPLAPLALPPAIPPASTVSPSNEMPSLPPINLENLAPPQPTPSQVGIGLAPLVPETSPPIINIAPQPPITAAPSTGAATSPFVAAGKTPVNVAANVQASAPAPSAEISSAGVPESEFRAATITRFEWPDKDPSTCKQKILKFLDTLLAGNFNAVIFQVRGQADVFYPSPYEPWAAAIGGKDPGFDPLQFAIDEAHARGLEFHAYINPYPVWQNANPPEHSTPEHPYWLHYATQGADNWACYDNQGNIMKVSASGDSYLFFSPGNPAVSAYARMVIMDIVKRYDVDGIHFDRIRYPGPQYSFDAVSKSRYAGDGNPDNLSWEKWQCDQVTRMLNDIYGEVMSVKPKVKITCSVWGIYDKTRIPQYDRFSSGIHEYYQDSLEWLKQGVVDSICPMIYWDIPDPKPNYDDLAKFFLQNAAGRHVYCYNHINNPKQWPPEEYLAQVSICRQLGGFGNVAFSSGGIERRQIAPYYRQAIYPKPVPVAPMPWKAAPQTGIIIGKALRRDNGEPIMDAWIKVEGQNRTWLSSADGFFAILNLPPSDNYKLFISKKNVGDAASSAITVEAGKATPIEVRL
ncbi:MAG TPA: family 10 glycosylhydrolase [Candidatus Sumerlaeota bacterium]|nr:MAG: hypothetical protein BWY12_01853 [candidate division BRC1 bacterium ADurb.Bin183]HOE62778.1 family 10 glycosylhydrolase [Candidatus Sumerlaeota bacterium]HRR29693.1 family 10 glycosylhydrolase [Candidatus Sumerlaeia bacterium]HON50362.1 family 10 glycosylhydrolase [Candidatus Sumerlaeota bacterium]HOR63578.1 family 10 glycosylhydrolase [Candidatus Sumerlaeota bacterium]